MENQYFAKKVNMGNTSGIYGNNGTYIRTYKFPLQSNHKLEIRLNIPDGATKQDMLEAVEHMKVVAGFMSED